jgi:hypothetical protein
MYGYTWNILLIKHEERKLLDKMRVISINNTKMDVQDVLGSSVYYIRKIYASKNEGYFFKSERMWSVRGIQVYSLTTYHIRHLKVSLIIVLIITLKNLKQRKEISKRNLYH